MHAIMIKDKEPAGRFLAVDLSHILSALGHRALASEWRVHGVWATGDCASELEAFGEQEVPIPGRTLKRLADSVVQIIDGEFTATDADQTEPWIVIEAVDSSYYTARSNDSAVLNPIREAFQHVCEYDHPCAEPGSPSSETDGLPGTAGSRH